MFGTTNQIWSARISNGVFTTGVFCTSVVLIIFIEPRTTLGVQRKNHVELTNNNFNHVVSKREETEISTRMHLGFHYILQFGVGAAKKRMIICWKYWTLKAIQKSGVYKHYLLFFEERFSQSHVGSKTGYLGVFPWYMFFAGEKNKSPAEQSDIEITWSPIVCPIDLNVYWLDVKYLGTNLWSNLW